MPCCLRQTAYVWLLTQIVCPFTTGSKPSWTAKLAGNQELLCSKIREEAGELCETLERQEGQERAASEMADLLYHSMVLLNVQVPPIALLFCVGDRFRAEWQMEHKQHNGNLVCDGVEGLSMPLFLVSRP